MERGLCPCRKAVGFAGSQAQSRGRAQSHGQPPRQASVLCHTVASSQFAVLRHAGGRRAEAKRGACRVLREPIFETL